MIIHERKQKKDNKSTKNNENNEENEKGYKEKEDRIEIDNRKKSKENVKEDIDRDFKHRYDVDNRQLRSLNKLTKNQRIKENEQLKNHDKKVDNKEENEEIKNIKDSLKNT
jgi:hypothetical protein